MERCWGRLNKKNTKRRNRKRRKKVLNDGIERENKKEEWEGSWNEKRKLEKRGCFRIIERKRRKRSI